MGLELGVTCSEWSGAENLQPRAQSSLTTSVPSSSKTFTLAQVPTVLLTTSGLEGCDSKAGDKLKPSTESSWLSMMLPVLGLVQNIWIIP